MTESNLHSDEQGLRDRLFAQIAVNHWLATTADIESANRSDRSREPLGQKLVRAGLVSSRDREAIEHLVERVLAQADNEALAVEASATVSLKGARDTATASFHNSRTAAEFPGNAIGEYQVLKQIGEGGMGVVYKARHTKLNRLVALKMIRAGSLAESDEIARFFREAEAAAKLDHPGIVSLFEIGEANGQHFFSMAFVDGETLAEQVKREGPLPPQVAAQIIRDCADAVHHAHTQDVIHRDIKPHNILLDQQGRPRVADFGLAKLQVADTQMTVAGQVLGTPAFMPAEQAAGELNNVGESADVYSLGATLYFLLTGRPPFQSANVAETLRQVIETEPVPPCKQDPGIPRDLEIICLKCLRKEPKERYASAEELSRDLRRWLNHEPIVARRVGRIERTWKWCKRNHVVAGLSAATFLIVIIGSIAFWARQTSVYVEGLVSQLRVADEAKVTRVVEELAQYGSWSHASLRNIFEDSEDGSPEKLNAALALLTTSDAPIAYVQQQILRLSEADFGYISPICDNLGRQRKSTAAWAQQTYEDPGKPSSVRFRAGLALAYLEGDAYSWKPTGCQFLVNELVATNPAYQPPLWEALASIQAKLLLPLEAAFGDRERPESEQLAAANAIAFFAAEDTARLEKLLLTANGPQFRALYVKYQEAANLASLKRLRAKVKVQPSEAMEVAERIQLGKERATAAITLLRQGERESILDVLRYDDDPEAMTQFIHRCRARGVTAAQLIELFEQVDQQRGPLDGDRKKIDDSVMYALILSLGEYAWEDLPPKRQTLAQRLALIYEKDPASGVHSATGWLLRQWGQQEAVDRVDQTPLPYDPTGHREWYVQEFTIPPRVLDAHFQQKTFHLTFIVFPAGEFTMGSAANEPQHRPNEQRHRVTLSSSIAVCDREVTWGQWMAMEGNHRRDLYARQLSMELGEGQPVFAVSWFEAIAFCCWLTEQAGMSESDQCYEDDNLPPPMDREAEPSDLRFHLERSGFRLPTEAEWEYVCRSGTNSAYSFGHDDHLLKYYSWYMRNSGSSTHQVGELRPNIRGLYDIHGNVTEWCHDGWTDEISDGMDPQGSDSRRDRVVRYGSWINPATECRSAYRGRDIATNRVGSLGFRVLSMNPAANARRQIGDSSPKELGR